MEGDHGKTKHKLFDCSIMDLADDIAFGVHDLEDALTMGLMDADDLASALPEESCRSFLDYIQTRQDFGNDVYAKPQTRSRIDRPVKYDLFGWTVNDDWPAEIPVTEAETDVFERWSAICSTNFSGHADDLRRRLLP